jgi:hypothetical protein
MFWKIHNLFQISFFAFFLELWIEYKALFMLSMHSTSELHLQTPVLADFKEKSQS